MPWCKMLKNRKSQMRAYLRIGTPDLPVVAVDVVRHALAPLEAVFFGLVELLEHLQAQHARQQLAPGLEALLHPREVGGVLGLDDALVHPVATGEISRSSNRAANEHPGRRSCVAVQRSAFRFRCKKQVFQTE